MDNQIHADDDRSLAGPKGPGMWTRIAVEFTVLSSYRPAEQSSGNYGTCRDLHQPHAAIYGSSMG
jgi:hypothetical protein